MSSGMNWWEWVQSISGGDTQAQIAERCGVSGGAVTNWKQGQRPSAEMAMQVARTYGEPPQLGLVVAGYMTAQEAHAYSASRAGTEIADAELVQAVERTMARHDVKEAVKEAVKELLEVDEDHPFTGRGREVVTLLRTAGQFKPTPLRRDAPPL